ncbi:hypothetical protein BFW01_g11507 [Lasiodiplodia theobromae]|nr:hypothetical protein BFW01_g11507 [Lasiodiplodia theobromae]
MQRPRYECDRCGVIPIRGTRWVCETCNEDLCDACRQLPPPADDHEHHLKAFPGEDAEGCCVFHTSHATAIDDAQNSSLRRLHNEYGSYEKLEREKREIRLVQVLDGEQPGAPLVCVLRKFPMERCENYTAVSYTWGDFRHTRAIRLIHWREGMRTEGLEEEDLITFQVTRSLHDVLQCLRHNPKDCSAECSGKFYWIDALCINQGDPDERSHQVAMMREIYSRAARVSVFLGQKYAGDEVAEVLNVISSAVKAQLGDGVDVASSSNDVLAHLVYIMANARFTRRGGEELPTEMVLKWLSKLFSSPWFGRVWVLQEVYCARPGAAFVETSHTSRISWSQLIMAKNLYYFYWRLLPWQDTIHKISELWSDLYRLQTEKQQDAAAAPQTGYKDALWLFEQTLPLFGASDPRDHLYGILGLCTDDWNVTGVDLLVPDYTRPASQVYAAFARDCIRRSGSLRALAVTSTTTTSGDHACRNCQHHCANEAENDHPSWAPWNVAKRGHGKSLLPAAPDANLVGAGFEVDRGLLLVDDGGDPRVLSLRGVRLDAVEGFWTAETFFPPIVPLQQQQRQPPPNRSPLAECWEVVKKLYHAGKKFHGSHPNNNGNACPYGTSGECQFDASMTDGELFEVFVETLLRKTEVTGCGAGVGTRKTIWEEQPDLAARVAAYWMHFRGDPEMAELPPATRASLRAHVLQDGEEATRKLAFEFGEEIEAAAGHLFFMTRKGRIGLCPVGVKNTDVVAALFGGRALYILRPRGQSRFEFVGECYLHGCMDGKAARGLCKEMGAGDVFELQ